MIICDVLFHLVPFLQFKIVKKHTWGSDTFSKRKPSLLHGCFSRFLNYTNGTKSRKASHMRIQVNQFSENWLLRSRSPLGELNISTVTYHAYFFHLESNNQVWNNGKRFYQKYLRGSKPESTGRIFCLICRASYLTIFKKLRHSCLIGS